MTDKVLENLQWMLHCNDTLHWLSTRNMISGCTKRVFIIGICTILHPCWEGMELWLYTGFPYQFIYSEIFTRFHLHSIIFNLHFISCRNWTWFPVTAGNLIQSVGYPHRYICGQALFNLSFHHQDMLSLSVSLDMRFLGWFVT